MSITLLNPKSIDKHNTEYEVSIQGIVGSVHIENVNVIISDNTAKLGLRAKTGEHHRKIIEWIQSIDTLVLTKYIHKRTRHNLSESEGYLYLRTQQYQIDTSQTSVSTLANVEIHPINLIEGGECVRLYFYMKISYLNK